MGLEIEAGWAREPIAIDFLGDRFWLRPGLEMTPGAGAPKVDALPDISVGAPDATASGAYLHRIRRFLSLLCWFDDRRIIESAQVGSGGPNPSRVGNATASRIRPHYTTDMELRVEQLPSVPSDEAWLGLALYREALGLNSVAYQVLGFLKIINICYRTGPEQTRYINGALPFLGGYHSAPRLAQLQSQHPDVGAYLYESCRCAAAHANTQPLVNPDDSGDIVRLHADVNLIKDLARHFIEYELGIRSAQTVRREHLYQTDGFEQVLPAGFVGSVTSGISLPTSSVHFANVDLRVRGRPQGTSLANCRVDVQAVNAGRLQLRLRSTNPADALEFNVTVDVRQHQLEFDPIAGLRRQQPNSPDTAAAAIDALELQRAMILNGILEIYETGSTHRLGRMEPFIPNSLDLGESTASIDAAIASLRTQFGL